MLFAFVEPIQKRDGGLDVLDNSGGGTVGVAASGSPHADVVTWLTDPNDTQS
ncbi:hypothetical protein [Streptomyces sp. NPDC056296]|uniref:hypothetical protein n=1 Tax=Streptomyces sp. NPDC056296 TaxID=3345775 RepID=UPI0035D66F89